MLVTWGLNIASYYLVHADDDVTTTQRTWQRAVFEALSLENLDDPVYAKIAIKIRYGFPGGVNNELFCGLAASLYRISGTSSPYNETLMFSGIVERLVKTSNNAYSIDITSNRQFWSKTIPRVFSAVCGYTNTTQCSFALTCNKSYAACQANNQTGIFGGFRFMPPEGSKIIFREIATTTSGGDTPEGTTPVIIPVR